MDMNEIITKIGLAAHGGDKLNKNRLAEEMGLSRSYLDKLAASNELDQKTKLQFLGFIDWQLADLRDRIDELEKAKQEIYKVKT